jgi:hypothetical protein
VGRTSSSGAIYLHPYSIKEDGDDDHGHSKDPTPPRLPPYLEIEATTVFWDHE